MKIINKLTLRYLKQNKKRTIFTILSIVLSITMINAVGISLNSAMKFYQKVIEINQGNYHYQLTAGKKESFDYIKKDNQIQSYYITNTKEYNYKNHSDFVLKRGDLTYFKNRNKNKDIEKGRLPENSKELAILKPYLKEIDPSKNIGDFITIKDDKKSYTFKIVGFIKGYETTNSYERSYNAVSYIDLANKELYTISITDKDVSKNIFTHAFELQKKICELENVESVRLSYNSSYLAIQNVFEENSNSIFLMIYRLVAIILAIIMIASVIIIYQAFNLSTNDRVQYLGMLASVGATPIQKKKSVYFEGLILMIISLPIGLLLSYIGLFITFNFINSLDIILNTGTTIHTIVSLQFTLITIALSVITVFISLILPARKLSKISVLDALKKSDEIKVKSKKLKMNFLSRKIFNYQYQLAIKNYKRQGRRAKGIILSLVLSMVLFISIFSFSNLMHQEIVSSNAYDLYDVNVNIADEKKEIDKFKNILKKNDKVEGYYYKSLDYNFVAEFDFNYFEEDIKDSVSNIDGSVGVAVKAIDDKSFEKICKDNDIEFKGIYQVLVSDYIRVNGKKVSYKKDIDKDFIKNLKYEDCENNKVIKIPDFESINYVSKDTYYLNQEGWITFIVPMSYYQKIEKPTVSCVDFDIKATKHQELCKDLKKYGYYPFDYAQNTQDNRQAVLIVQIFMGGFTCLVIIFSILNIVNMMNASIDKRQKEFAMLLSVGTSPTGIKKMILYESFIYGFKTLLYGVPISIFIEWILYKQINTLNSFHISIFAYIVSFVVIMFVMLLTFKMSLKKIDKQNIIESLKDDM